MRQVPPNVSDWYDLVVGPVAAVWRTRLTITNSDQFSFHTPAGGSVLNGVRKRVEKVI
jgi:hypothetical protein